MINTIQFSEETRRSFANRFLKWGIMLREAVIDRASIHVIAKEDWHIKFIEGENAEGKYLEFYTTHPTLHDTHFRIYDNGQEEELEALTDGYDYNEALPGDKRLQRQTFVENNKKVYEQLKNVGLQM